MQKAFEILKNQRQKNSSPILADMEKYLETGDQSLLKKVVRGSSWQYYSTFWSCETSLANSLSFSENMDETDLRLLDMLVNLEMWKAVVSDSLKQEKGEQNLFSVLHDAFRRCGKSEAETAMEFWNCGCFFNASGKPNSGTDYYLSMDEKEFTNLVALFSDKTANLNLTQYLLEHEPGRIDGLLDCLVLFKPDRYFSDIKFKSYTFMTASAMPILKKRGNELAKRVKTIWEPIDLYAKVCSGIELSEVCPDVFLEPTKKAAVEYMKILKEYPVWLLCFLMRHFGKEYLPLVFAFFEKHPEHYVLGIDDIFTTALDIFKSDAINVFDAVKDHSNLAVRFSALRCLISANNTELGSAIEDRFHSEFARNVETLELILLAKKWKPERFTETFWKLLGNKSKPVRETAARILGDTDNIDLERVAKLLVDKKADKRDSAVNILARQESDKAIKLLEDRIDVEENDDIRDKILIALESAWEAKGKKITMKTIGQRIDRAAAKTDKFQPDWLDFKKLPPLRVGKKTLDAKTLRYLLYRQSRCKDIHADVEAKPLLAMIDRKTSGDFAFFVLNSFLVSKTDAADRWALALAGLLGDDRIVPVLSKQIQTWADSSRGKMSEYAVQALALLGSETALTVINAMTIRYRTKYKNVGAAAADAFERVAEERGMTADELGDRVVPALGFEPDRPRIWTVAGKDFEVRIGMDFKVTLYDTEKKKSVSSLPKTAPKGSVAELKELKDALKEVVKGQLLRVENLLIRQYRWPVEAWTELYLRQPVLRPFTVRLVWGIYDAPGKLQATFRALEDGSLTDVDDETVSPPPAGKIGIVHPLELAEEERDAWSRHLLDFEIVQPFPQLQRDVLVPTEEEKPWTVSKRYYGRQLNAMTFKGRAEKLGWRRGSVCDGGWIPAYWKSFPEAGADAFLDLDNFFIGIGVDDQVTLHDLYFVPAGSVQIGSYVYDEPDTTRGDSRLLPFGKVPPIVFSEVMGDLRKIAPEENAK